MARLMKAHGYLALTFDSGANFLSSKHHADCLIVDVQMPGMTGLELHHRLVAAGQPIPTILITAHPDEAVRMGALQAGAHGFLIKPFSEDDLLGCVRSAVGRSDANGRKK